MKWIKDHTAKREDMRVRRCSLLGVMLRGRLQTKHAISVGSRVIGPMLAQDRSPPVQFHEIEISHSTEVTVMSEALFVTNAISPVTLPTHVLAQIHHISANSTPRVDPIIIDLLPKNLVDRVKMPATNVAIRDIGQATALGNYYSVQYSVRILLILQ